MSQRPYDVVVFGATGFTGKLVAKYLQSHSGKPSWAIAGRSRDRLQAVQKQLKLGNNVGIILATTNDQSSLEQMAAQAKCIINVVGPYRLFGATNVIEACLKQHTNYVDLTGETQFAADVIAAYHDRAKAQNVIIACSSGYDSVPSDLTTYLAVQHAKRKAGKSAIQSSQVRSSLVIYPLPATEPMGAFSTGTLLSLIDACDVDSNQFAFSQPDRLATRKPAADMRFAFAQPAPQFGKRKYGSSWILSAHNEKHVYRSWSLLSDAKADDGYGDAFSYDENVVGGSWLFTFFQAVFFYVFAAIIAKSSFVRSLLKRILPPNGGPSDKLQSRMTTQVRTVANLASSSSICSLKAPGHPGYSVTAALIAESALVIALEQQSFHQLAKHGGCLTSATIAPQKLAERLQQYGKFDIVCLEFEQSK